MMEILPMNDERVREGQFPLVSVVVINFNGRKYLGDILDNCIISILNNDYDNLELIIVDNGSSDGSVEYIESKFGYDGRVKIFSLKDNMGTAGGKNIGIYTSKGKYVFILNNDIVLKKKTLRKMVDIFENNDKIGVLGCVLITPDGDIQTEGEFFTKKISLLKILYPSLLDKVSKNRIIKNRKNNLNLVDWLVGAAVMLKKTVLMDINLYDEEYFMYSGEVDIAYRIKKSGYINACINDYNIIHYGNVTASHYSKWQRDLLARNSLMFLLKHHTGIKLAHSLLVYFIGIFRDLFYSLFSFDELEWRIALSKIKAFRYVKIPARAPS